MSLSNQEVSTIFFGFSIQWVEKETIAKDISVTNCRGAFCLTEANNVAYTCLTLKTYCYWSSRSNFDLKIPVRMQINIIIYFQFWHIWRVLQTHFCFRQYNLKTFDSFNNPQEFLFLKAACRMPVYYFSEQDKYVHNYPVKV